ncbi:MAG: hypothetical protein AAGF12_24790 [Myxococcota bacterium]
MATGLSETKALHLLTAFIVGGVAFQILSAVIADRFAKRGLLGLMGVVLSLAAIAMGLLPPHLAPAPTFVAGGAVLAMYGLSLALLGERFQPDELPVASASFLILYQVGSIAGSLVAGGAMEAVGEAGLPAAFTAVGIGVAIVAAGRGSFRRSASGWGASTASTLPGEPKEK